MTMFMRRWFDKMLPAPEDPNVNFNSQLVKSALWGMFAIETPHVVPAMSDPGIHQELLAAETHLDRIKIMRPFFSADKFHTFLNNIDKLLEKDDAIAGMFVQKYEELFRSSNLKMAIRTLNLAAMFATKEKVGGIYRMRSTLHYNRGNWQSCLQDIELGLKMNCPTDMVEELNVRKLKCENAGIMYPRPPERPEVSAKRAYRENVVFDLYKGSNEKIPAASSVVELRWDEDRGRGLFTTEDVEPGTTLIIEDPYVASLNEGLNWVISHCWRCLKGVQSIIPCDDCVFAVYCSEECRSEDIKHGHPYECACLPYFHGALLGANMHLSFKAITEAGPKELYKFYKAATLEEIQEMWGLDSRTGVYDSTSYLTSLNLASHIENDGRLPEIVWFAISFTEILDAKTNFFAEIEESEKEDFKAFVASLALFHNLAVPFNCVALEEVVDGSDGIGLSIVTPEKKEVCYVIGVYPLISLMNHSCDPNVNRTNLPNGKMAIMTLRGLKAGEELLFGYGFDYATHSFDERQDSLLKIYLFECLCLACKSDWPVYQDLSDRADQIKLRCPDCTHFRYDQSDQCALEDLENGFGKCPSCLNEISLEPLYEELRVWESELPKCRRLLVEKNPAPVIVKLVEYIKLLEIRVCQPSYEFCAAQRILAKAYSMIGED